MSSPQPTAEQVREFVIAGHGNFAKVKQMLAAQPSLLNQANEWRPGDRETAVQAAAHVGNRPIAEYLLDQGAPLAICRASTLDPAKLNRTAPPPSAAYARAISRMASLRLMAADTTIGAWRACWAPPSRTPARWRSPKDTRAPSSSSRSYRRRSLSHALTRCLCRSCKAR